MTILIEGRAIGRVAVVDDDPEVRGAYEYVIEDANAIPVEEVGPLPSLDEISPAIPQRADAAICDHQLRVGNYAHFDGAALVASLYQRKMPAVLCTRWDAAMIDAIRPYRSRVPVVMTPDQLSEPDDLIKALEICVREIDVDFRPDRRPWNAQVHLLEIVDSMLFVEVPSWGPEVIRLPGDAVPAEVRESLERSSSCYAQVNLGAEDINEVYFDEWTT